MSSRMIVRACAVALGLSMIAAAVEAADSDRAASEMRLAQAAPEPPRVVRARPRIEVYPGRPLHRECVDGYREVWRPYWGTSVVMPYMHCWWVRG